MLYRFLSIGLLLMAFGCSDGERESLDVVVDPGACQCEPVLNSWYSPGICTSDCISYCKAWYGTTTSLYSFCTSSFGSYCEPLTSANITDGTTNYGTKNGYQCGNIFWHNFFTNFTYAQYHTGDIINDVITTEDAKYYCALNGEFAGYTNTSKDIVQFDGCPSSEASN